MTHSWWSIWIWILNSDKSQVFWIFDRFLIWSVCFDRSIENGGKNTTVHGIQKEKEGKLQSVSTNVIEGLQKSCLVIGHYFPTGFRSKQIFNFKIMVLCLKTGNTVGNCSTKPCKTQNDIWSKIFFTFTHWHTHSPGQLGCCQRP